MDFYLGICFWGSLIILLIPYVFLKLNGFNTKYLLFAITMFFIYSIYKSNVFSMFTLFLFVFFQFILIKMYIQYGFDKDTGKSKNLLKYFILLSIFPILLSRSVSLFNNNIKLGFLGISYITFKAVQILIEINDKLIDDIKFFDYLNFMLFFPTISSGPIDRSRRFFEDLNTKKSKEEYIESIGIGIGYVIQGLFYSVIISQLLFDRLNLFNDRYNIYYSTRYMYIYGFYLFFDFAGYSLMAVGVSKILGIDTPMNFNKPFIAKDLKDFWNRWHISLSHWFRDYIFSRLVFTFFKRKTFKKQTTVAMVSYIINMTIMGLWHGFDLSYLIYGLYHGILLALTDYIQTKKIYKKYKKEKWFGYLSIFVTFHIVMVGFFIFSGRFIEILVKIGVI